MTVAGQTISDEQIADLATAAKNATPGRRAYVHDEDRDDYVIVAEPNDTPLGRFDACLDAEFAAEMTPETALALLTELQHRREAEAGTIADGVRKAIAVVDTYIGGEHEANGRAASEIADDLRGLVQDLAASPSSPASGGGWCQPKDMKHRVWVVMYEDADRGNAVFTHEDAERLAKEQYVRSAPSWNCYLFAAQPELIGTPEGYEIEDRLSGRVLSALGEHP